MNDLFLSEYEIKRKYLKPPTPLQVTDFIKELGVTFYQFERFYSLPHGLIKQVNGGHRNFPTKFWPIIYQKIVPQYGMAFMNYSKPKKSVTRTVTRQANNPTSSHDRLVSVH